MKTKISVVTLFAALAAGESRITAAGDGDFWTVLTGEGAR